MSNTNWEVEIEKIKGDIRLIENKLDTIKNNHLWHIERDLNRLNKLAWTVGIMVFTNLAFLLRDTFF